MAAAQPVTGGHSSSPARPLHVLREYAVFADGERGAVIGPHGGIDWMCLPTWHSGSIFGELIGAAGGYALTTSGRFVWGGYYEAGSLIWRSHWITEAGIVECREALAFPGDPHRAVVLRRVQPLDCAAELEVRLEPAPDYGRTRMRDPRFAAGHWTARIGDVHLRWSGADAAQPTGDGRGWSGHLTVLQGEHHDLVLELADRPLPSAPPHPDELWERTADAWARAIPELAECLSPEDARHSYAVMRGLTGSSGGMTAAVTTSLPERADAGRAFDYRYVWIRDQSFAGQAVAADGPHPVLDDAVRFVTARLLADGPDLMPAYTTAGGRVPDEQHLDLAGYPGGSDVVGNHVNSQFQLDAFGEALLLLASAARHGHLDDDGARAAQVAVRAIVERWQRPDAGIWELDPQFWTHSRLIAAAGLRAAAAHPLMGCDGEDCARLADHLVGEMSARALHPDGRWQRAPDDPRHDGALLLPGLRGAVPADDPRTVATLRTYLADLTKRGYAFRFRPDERPLGEAEGSFLLCGFLTAMALHQQGDTAEAGRWFERNRAAAGAPQLYSEEFDATQHQLRGNLPQAFVHAYQLEASVRLARPPQTRTER